MSDFTVTAPSKKRWIALTEPHPTGNCAVAAYLGRPVHELWPDWYDRDGNRTRSTAGKGSRASGTGQRQKWRPA